MIRAGVIAALMSLAAPAFAEHAEIGSVELNGLARDQPYRSPGPENAMVCNVNGPDGFLAVRSGPGTGHAITRKLKRLAVVVYDNTRRQGHWVPISQVYRSTDSEGRPIAQQNMALSGWVHDGYLCDFLD